MIESVQWYQTREYNFGIFFFLCVYLLNYRSELAQIWRQDTEYHPRSQSYQNSMQVRSTIIVMEGGFGGILVQGQSSQMSPKAGFFTMFKSGCGPP